MVHFEPPSPTWPSVSPHWKLWLTYVQVPYSKSCTTGKRFVISKLHHISAAVASSDWVGMLGTTNNLRRKVACGEAATLGLESVCVGAFDGINQCTLKNSLILLCFGCKRGSLYVFLIQPVLLHFCSSRKSTMITMTTQEQLKESGKMNSRICLYKQALLFCQHCFKSHIGCTKRRFFSTPQAG